MKKSRPKDMLNGCLFNSNNSGVMEIIGYFCAKNVKVRFLDTGYEVSAQADKIRNGKVKDRMRPRVAGVGFVGDGNYKSKINNKSTTYYSRWSSMIKRCYDRNDPAYNYYGAIGCKVCKEWHNFQNYAEWLNMQGDINGLHVDKDLLSVDQKLYSPETCSILNVADNVEVSHAKEFSLVSPSGDVVNFINMSKFCRDNNLTLALLHKVYQGKRNHHKGWTSINR